MCQALPTDSAESNDSESFRCFCPEDFVGKRCQYLNLCRSNNGICNGNGECKFFARTEFPICSCREGYYGLRCEFQEDNTGLKHTKIPVKLCVNYLTFAIIVGCGFHTTNETGKIVYERPNSATYPIGYASNKKICRWYIHLFDTRKVSSIILFIK